MMRLFGLLALALVVVPSTVCGQVKLERKFPEGSNLARSVDVMSKQTLVIQGMNVESSSQQNSVIRAEVGKRGGDGELRVDYKVETMQQTVKAPGLGEVMFDSANPDKSTESPITPLLKAASKATWTMVVDRENKVVRVEGSEKAVEGLEPALQEALKARLDPGYMKEAAQLELERIPSKPVKVGESWEQLEPMRLDGSQTLTFTKKYTYRGEVEEGGKKLHKIDVTATEVKLDMDGANPQMIKLVKSDLKIAMTSGALLFDSELGTVVSDKQVNQIKGSITLSVAGVELPAELDLTLDSSTMARR